MEAACSRGGSPACLGAEEEIAEGNLIAGDDFSLGRVVKDFEALDEGFGEKFAQPVLVDGGGEGQEDLEVAVLALHFADFGSDEKFAVADGAFAREDAFAPMDEAAAEGAGLATHCDLVGKTGEDAALDGFVGGVAAGFRVSGRGRFPGIGRRAGPASRAARALMPRRRQAWTDEVVFARRSGGRGGG